jgi:hypothetical protein
MFDRKLCLEESMAIDSTDIQMYAAGAVADKFGTAHMNVYKVLMFGTGGWGGLLDYDSLQTAIVQNNATDAQSMSNEFGFKIANDALKIRLTGLLQANYQSGLQAANLAAADVVSQCLPIVFSTPPAQDSPIPPNYEPFRL